MNDKPEAVVTAEALLAKHYGEPVRPVSHYCDALRTWAACIRQNVQEVHDQDTGSRFPEIVESLPNLELAIAKSNLLWRLIYCGCSVRTVPCPEHKGRWSGCSRPGTCECQHGLDITGWLPNDEDHPEASALMLVTAREQP